MTPSRLRECLALLAWSQRGLATLLNRQEGTVRQWARGAVQIPDDVAAWLEARTKYAAKTPPPVSTVVYDTPAPAEQPSSIYLSDPLKYIDILTRDIEAPAKPVVWTEATIKAAVKEMNKWGVKVTPQIFRAALEAASREDAP